MDQNHQRLSRTQDDSEIPLGSLSLSDEAAELSSTDVAGILQATAGYLSRSSPTSMENLVEKANDEEILGKLEEVVKTYFRPLKLTSLPSIIVYLLVNYFLLRGEKKEAVAAKKLYEDHIALLKDKSSELEERLKETEGRGRESSPLSPSSSESSLCSELCQSCEEYRKESDSLTKQYTKLKQSYDELCHINQQWALDYEALTRQISNATGFHSVANTSSARSTPNSTSTQATVASSSSANVCQRCLIYESQVQDKKHEIEDLSAMIVGLREDVKECKERLSQKQRELSSLENEYQILRLQMQEIGDLQQTLNMKQDYRKLQYSLQHKNKLYQEAMCEKLELQKQVEKLRQAFLKFFPAPVPAPAHHAPLSSGSSHSSAPHTRTAQCYSFPMHSCRHNLQSAHMPDPSPPTPPGLLARGDLRGGLVEKDEHPGALPGIRVEEHHTSAANHLAPINKSHHHGGHMTNGLDHMTQYRHDVGARPASATELVMTNQNAPSRSHGVAVMTQARMPHPVAGGDHKSHSHSDMSHPHSSIASHSSTNSHPSYSPSSQGHSSHSHSSLSPHMTTMSGPGSNTHPPLSLSLSSLGYASDERNSTDTSLVHSTPNLVYHFPQRSKGNLAGSTDPEMTTSANYRRSRQMQKSLSEDANDTQQVFPRPTSLGLISRGGVAGSAAVPEQQYFVCPSCGKALPAHGQLEGAESWFQHIKFCGGV